MDDNNAILNEDDCTSILRNYLKNKDCELTSYKIEPLSTKDGFLGEHFTITLQYNDEKQEITRSFFLKIINGSSKVISDLCKDLNVYEKEEYYYTVLIPEFKKYNIDVSFAPKCYLCKPFYLVLEDLSKESYKGRPKTQFLDKDHSLEALKTLADFHASSVAYEELKSKDDGKKYRLMDHESHSKYLKDLDFTEENSAASKWLKYTMEGIFELIGSLPIEKCDREDFSERLQAVLENSSRENKEQKGRGAVLHGDLWSCNFLYRYDGEIPASSKLVDFQIVKYGPPALDVLQFIYSNTRKDFRNQHKQEMLDAYYKYLTHSLKKLDIDCETIFPKLEFSKTCKEVEIPAKLQALSDRTITFSSDVDFVEALKCEETLSAFLFEDRSKHIVKAFENNASFRELILEDLLELKDMISSV